MNTPVERFEQCYQELVELIEDEPDPYASRSLYSDTPLLDGLRDLHREFMAVVCLVVAGGQT